MININLFSQVLVKVAVKELVWLESVYCIVDAFIVIKIDWLFWYYDVEKKWNLEKQLRVRLWKKAMPKEKHYHNFTWKRKNEVSFSLGNCRPSRVVFHCKWLMIFGVEGCVSCPPCLHWSIVFKINTLFII